MPKKTEPMQHITLMKLGPREMRVMIEIRKPIKGLRLIINSSVRARTASRRAEWRDSCSRLAGCTRLCDGLLFHMLSMQRQFRSDEDKTLSEVQEEPFFRFALYIDQSEF
jgi:hypothetical protein